MCLVWAAIICACRLALFEPLLCSIMSGSVLQLLMARVQQELLAKQATEASNAAAAQDSSSATAAKDSYSATAAKDSYIATAAKDSYSATAANNSYSATAAKDSYTPTAAKDSYSATAAKDSYSATATKVPADPIARKEPDVPLSRPPEAMLETDPDSDEEERRALAAELVPAAYFAGEEGDEEEDEMWDDEVMEEWFKFKSWPFPTKDWKSWEAWNWGGKNSESWAWHEESGDWENEADDNEKKGKSCREGHLPSRPVATPVRAASTAAKPEPLHRLPSNSSLKAPHSETTLVMPGHVWEESPAPTAAAIAGDDLRINSTTHKREYMRLVDASAMYEILCGALKHITNPYLDHHETVAFASPA